MSNEESQGEFETPELTHIYNPMPMTVWDQAIIQSRDTNTLLTLLQHTPIYDADTSIKGYKQHEIAQYLIPGSSLLSTTEMFVRQTLMWAGHVGGDEFLSAVEERILDAIQDGKDRFESSKDSGDDDANQD